MRTNDLNVHGSSVGQMANEILSQDEFNTEIIDCVNMKQLFDLLGSSKADHIAILNGQQEEISDVFGYVQAAFARQETVPVALFFNKNRD